MASEKNKISAKICLNGEYLEQVESFVCLGSVFTGDGSSMRDIQEGLAMGHSVMQPLSSVWKSKDISVFIKVILLKALDWSVAIYWCDIKSVLKLSKCGATEDFVDETQEKWTDIRTAKCQKERIRRVKSLKMGYYGHVVRKYNSIEKEAIQGCTSGSRSRGRQRRRWTDDISDWTGVEINDAARVAELR